MQSLKIQLVLFFTLAVLGCDRASNQLHEVILACGADYIGPTQYLKVESSDLRLLSKEEFEVFRYEDFNLTSVPVSSRGCIQAPGNTSLLIRSANNDAATLVASESASEARLVRLLDVQETQVDFKCGPNQLSRVQADTRLSEFLSSDAPPEIRQAFAINLSVEGLDLTVHQISLADIDQGDSFVSTLPTGKALNLTFTVENLLIKNMKFAKTCPVLVDVSSPSLALKVSSAALPSKIDWHGVRDIEIVREEDVLTFETKDDDIAAVEYCAKRLDDDFVSDQAKKISEWRMTAGTTTCSSYRRFDRSRPFTMDSKGFWTVDYRAVDQAGNVSLIQKKNLLVESTSQIKLIQVNAKNTIRSHVLERDFVSALAEIVGLEADRQRLPTFYEREKAKRYVHSSMLNTLNQRSISIPLEVDERMGDHLLFGRRTGRLIGSVENKNLVFIDPKSGALQLSIPLAEKEVLRGFDVSLDESKIILRYHSFLEFWALSGQSFQKRHTMNFSDHIQVAQLSNDDRYIVAGAGTLRVYDTNTFEILREVSGSRSFRGSYPTAVSKSSSHVFYVTSEGKIERLELSSGTATILGDINQSMEVLQLVIDAEEKFILISDRETGLWRFDVKSGHLAAIDNPSKSNIERLAISPAGDKFASFASSGTLLVRSMLDGHIYNTLDGLQAPHYSLSFSSDGSKLAATGVFGQLRLWNLEDFLSSSIHSIDQSTLSEFFWKNDDELLVGHWPVTPSDSDFFGQINTTTHEFAITAHENAFDGKEYPAPGLAPFSSRWCFALLQKSGRASSACHRLFDIFYDELVVSADSSTAIRVVKSGSSGIPALEFISTIDFKVNNLIEVPDLTNVIPSKDGKIAYVFLGTSIAAISSTTGKFLWKTPLEGQPFRYWLSANQEYLLVSLADYSLAKIDSKTGAFVNEITWTSNQYASQIVGKTLTTSDDKYMLTQFNSGELSLWDVESREIILKLDSLWRSDSSQSVVAMNASGSRIAIGTLKSGLTHKVRILDLDYDRLLNTVCDLAPNRETRRRCESIR